VEAGADVIHCSQRRFWEPEFPEIDGHVGLNLAGWAKKVTGARTISVGSVGLSGDFIAAFTRGESSQPASLDELTRRMEREEFDLIAVGRALLADPHWASKVVGGASVTCAASPRPRWRNKRELARGLKSQPLAPGIEQVVKMTHVLLCQSGSMNSGTFSPKRRRQGLSAGGLRWQPIALGK